MARNDVYLNINALSPADAVVTGQQDMTAATVPELVLGDTPTFNFYFTDNTNVWPSWAGNAAYTLTWALSDAVAGDFAPAATTGNATPITGGWSVILPLNSYDLVGLLNTKRVGQPYPVTNLWQQLRVTDPSGNEVTRAMFWTPVRYRAISDTQNTESASPTGGRFVAVNNLNALTTPTAAQFYAANPIPTSALGTASNGELLIGNGTGFTKATLTAGSGVSITNGSGSITISATDGDITLDDGTAAAPSLKFTADTDTGIYRPSDNVLGISAGGVSRATFGATSAINGTTIPGSKTLVVTTDKLSALAATTSAELAGVISDETGTGALVFANTPTLVTPNIGAATGTSVNLSGAGTFGGNLTVSGTGTHSFNGPVSITGTTASNILRLTKSGAGSKTFGIDNALDFRIYADNGSTQLFKLTDSGDTTLAGNLTVSGTGTSSFAGTLNVTAASLGTFTSSTANAISGEQAFTIKGSNNSTSTTFGSGRAPSLVLWNNSGTANSYAALVFQDGGGNAVAGVQGLFIDDATNHGALTFWSRPASGSYTEAGRFTGSGNFLVGTTTDNGLGRLQVSGAITATEAAGTGLFGFFGGSSLVSGTLGAQSFILRTNNTAALTLDSSQNATFAGTIKPQQAATASAPTYVKGAIYFDTTLNKLRVGGATGWETITSV